MKLNGDHRGTFKMLINSTLGCEEHDVDTDRRDYWYNLVNNTYSNWHHIRKDYAIMEARFDSWSRHTKEIEKVRDLQQLLKKHTRFSCFASSYATRVQVKQFETIAELRKFVTEQEKHLPPSRPQIPQVHTGNKTPQVHKGDKIPGTKQGHPKPNKPHNWDCYQMIMKGSCEYGDRCRFNHDVDLTKQVRHVRKVCGGMYTEGRCNHDKGRRKCPYIHTRVETHKARAPPSNCPACLENIKEPKELEERLCFKCQAKYLKPPQNKPTHNHPRKDYSGRSAAHKAALQQQSNPDVCNVETKSGESKQHIDTKHNPVQVKLATIEEEPSLPYLNNNTDVDENPVRVVSVLEYSTMNKSRFWIEALNPDNSVVNEVNGFGSPNFRMA